jgi:glycine cleavage system H lipoate-binding protein
VSEEIEAERKAQLARIPEVMESPEGKGKAEPHEGSPGLARACVWMKAGVVNFRLCDQEYDCYHCEFDQRMRSAMGESPSSAGTRAGDWASHIHDRHAPAGQPCIHFLTGNPDAPSTCDHGHDCYRCPFHQGLNADAGKDKVEAPTCVVSSGYRLAEGVYYHFGHTWVHLERGGRVRTGMDDFAVKVFGKADSVELPPTGARLTQGEPGWMLIRNGREAAVQAPISGKVIAVNQTIQEDPETAHHDPYGDGWMLMMEPSHLKLELEGLYYGEDRLRWMEAEKQETVRLLGPRYEQLAATGGEPLDDLFGNVSELEWDQLVSTFLRTRKRE